MAYKNGTYKLNLGLDEVQKMQLDYLQGMLGLKNYSSTIRELLNNYYKYFVDINSKEVPFGYVLVKKQDLKDLREHLETCYLLQKKFKEDL